MNVSKAKRFFCIFLLAFAILSSSISASADALGYELFVGDTVSFGAYEQDNNAANGAEPIQWQVIAVDGDEALLLSQSVIENLQYHDSKDDVTWDNCSLRSWLNSDFLDMAFSNDQQAMIAVKTESNSSEECNPKWDTVSGTDTQDKVFLLSYTDITRYFDGNKAAQAQPTKYAKKQGASEWFTGNCKWWLRSPGKVQHDACVVSTKGKPETWSVKDKNGVRPALWLRLHDENPISLPDLSREEERPVQLPLFEESESTTDESSLSRNALDATPIPTATVIPTDTPKPTQTPEPTSFTPALADSIGQELKIVKGLQFERGSKGNAVKCIQQMLIMSGYLPEGQADGAFGKKTEAAVKSFQSDNGITASGIVDFETQYRLAERASGFSWEKGNNWDYAGVDGYGVVRFDDGVYIGLIEKGTQYKEGTFYYPVAYSYAGSFKNNLRSGNGEAWFANGDHYVGEWANDTMNGEGVYYFGLDYATEHYEGEWKDGKMSGKGTYTLFNGVTVSGKWQDNRHVGW